MREKLSRYGIHWIGFSCLILTLINLYFAFDCRYPNFKYNHQLMSLGVFVRHCHLWGITLVIIVMRANAKNPVMFNLLRSSLWSLMRGHSQFGITTISFDVKGAEAGVNQWTSVKIRSRSCYLRTAIRFYMEIHRQHFLYRDCWWEKNFNKFAQN